MADFARRKKERRKESKNSSVSPLTDGFGDLRWIITCSVQELDLTVSICFFSRQLPTATCSCSDDLVSVVSSYIVGSGYDP